MIGFGPLDEKEATVGAALSTGSRLFRMLALGVLANKITNKMFLN